MLNEKGRVKALLKRYKPPPQKANKKNIKYIKVLQIRQRFIMNTLNEYKNKLH